MVEMVEMRTTGLRLISYITVDCHKARQDLPVWH